ncbi:heavy metal translocating P-type ATPase [Maridesulfovibrio sp.]|uniref:heavy metal translocating P-type ATPase n=1 Tax=Maridesulfovibrio sp. TaxID=2795000 RepID=UPI002A18B371|nr:heavy metal translocating P-type ATPase [Maridesulfovibrio sp.]
MSSPFQNAPRVVHETRNRLRIRWKTLLSPELDSDYLAAWISNLPGVRDVRVNPQGRCLIIRYNGTPESRNEILEGLNRIPPQAFSRAEPAVRRRRLIDAAWSSGLAAGLPFMPATIQAPVATAMGMPAVLAGLDTLISDGPKARVLDMTTIGASLLRADYTTAASISSMVVIGECLRQITDDRSNSLLKSLTASPVKEIWVEQDGKEVSIPFEKVQAGDVVLFSSGELIAVDGTITDGEAILDRSSITGESAPVKVSPGDEVVSGSILVEGELRVKAAGTASETSMARITRLMTGALSEQSATERKSSRLADALTPVTLGLGAALYAATGDMERALSVLTIDFACAVKFPAPVVIKTSMYAAAKEGVIFKSGTALESLAEVDAIVFDKTGTLTRGELDVTDIIVCSPRSEDELLNLAAAVENRHGHPVGQGIIREAEKRGLPPLQATDTDLSIAHGVSGVVNGSLVRAGSRHFIADDCGTDCSAVSDRTVRLRSEGKTLVYVSCDGHLEGIVALIDTIRPEAETVLESLKETGIKKIVMLTGDHAGTAAVFKKKLPLVDEIRTDLTPELKSEVVGDLQSEGYRVAVVGDGVNDAPAFTVAGMGICMSRSTGLARESAHVVLDRNSLDGLLTARAVSLRVNGILQNCFNTGVTVNTGLLAAAMAGKLSPALAATLHNLNTFAILGAAAWASSRAMPQ